MSRGDEYPAFLWEEPPSYPAEGVNRGGAKDWGRWGRPGLVILESWCYLCPWEGFFCRWETFKRGCGNSLVGSQKVKHRIATGSRISLLGVHPKELKAETQISVLGSIVHNSQRGGGQPKRPLPDECNYTNKMWYNVHWNVSLKKEDNSNTYYKWINLEDITLSKVSQI